jgi:hypothetical protein
MRDEEIRDVRAAGRSDHPAAALEALGWTASTGLMYDEECVEGWTWTSPGGREYTVIGLHDEPPPLPELPAPPNPDPARLADLLDSLMKTW